jgi:hypothetical protein
VVPTRDLIPLWKRAGLAAGALAAAVALSFVGADR